MQKNKRKRTELQEMKTAPGLQRRTLSLEGRGLSEGRGARHLGRNEEERRG